MMMMDMQHVIHDGTKIEGRKIITKFCAFPLYFYANTTNMRFLAIYTLSLSLLIACNNPTTPARKLVWSDEFEYKGLPDSTKWAYDTGGHGWGNNELQYYTAARTANARVENGQLIIEAHREAWEGKEYTSARLVTRGKAEWQYGRIEVKARIPEGLGTWPAIWLLANTQPFKWPDDGEIDIMEHVGFNPGYIHGSVHCKSYYHSIGTQKTDTTFVPDFANSFHVYALEWTKDSIHTEVDGKSYFSFGNEKTGYATWPFDNKMYLLLNIAVGGNWGGAKGVDSTIWPRKMEVDYVRVYE